MDNHFHLQFPNLGFIGCELSEEELKPIRDEVEEISKNFETANPLNERLVGHIKKEYTLQKVHKHIEKLALQMAYSFRVAHHYADPKIDDLFLVGSWVNFQKKHEFNPLHNHDGEYVFVIWLDVPYHIEDEIKMFPDIPTRNSRAGHFSFQYINSLGNMLPWTIPVDKTYEGKMILFPADLNHEVHPFYTSDDYRISVSGNLHLKPAYGNNR